MVDEAIKKFYITLAHDFRLLKILSCSSGRISGDESPMNSKGSLGKVTEGH